MGQRIVLSVLVAVAAFLLVLVALQWRDRDDDVGRIVDDETELVSGDPRDLPRPSEFRRRDVTSSEFTHEPVPTTDSSGPSTGSILVRAALLSGLVPPELAVRARRMKLTPSSVEGEDVFRAAGGPSGFEVTDLAPGNYQVRLDGGDIVPFVRGGIPVKAGERTLLDFTVVRGVRPKGRVMDARGRVPLAGAEVHFGEAAPIYTDDVGQFEVMQLIPKNSLRRIRVSAKGYDAQVSRQLLIPDPRDIELFLGGGDHEIDATVVNQSGSPLPEAFTVFLQATPGVWETRREINVYQSDRFDFENLYPAEYRIVVEFPGGTLPTLYRRLVLQRDDKVHKVTFTVTEGARLRGRIVAPQSLGLARKIEVLGGGPVRKVVAHTVADKDGRFDLKHLPSGKHIVRIGGEKSGFYLRSIDLVEHETTERDIELLRHAWVDKKTR